MPSRPIRVMVALQHRMLLDAVCEYLVRIADLDVFAATLDSDVTELARSAEPDVVVVEHGPPEWIGAQLAENLQSSFALRTIILRREESLDDQHQPASNISELVFLNAPMSTLVSVILSVGSNDSSPGASDDVPKRRQEAPLSVLTQREREVLRLIAVGRATKEIGEMIRISVRTVERHRFNIMHKLDIRTAAALARYAVRHGLVMLLSRSSQGTRARYRARFGWEGNAYESQPQTIRVKTWKKFRFLEFGAHVLSLLVPRRCTTIQVHIPIYPYADAASAVSVRDLHAGEVGLVTATKEIGTYRRGRGRFRESHGGSAAKFPPCLRPSVNRCRAIAFAHVQSIGPKPLNLRWHCGSPAPRVQFMVEFQKLRAECVNVS